MSDDDVIILSSDDSSSDTKDKSDPPIFTSFTIKQETPAPEPDSIISYEQPSQKDESKDIPNYRQSSLNNLIKLEKFLAEINELPSSLQENPCQQIKEKSPQKSSNINSNKQSVGPKYTPLLFDKTPERLEPTPKELEPTSGEQSVGPKYTPLLLHKTPERLEPTSSKPSVVPKDNPFSLYKTPERLEPCSQPICSQGSRDHLPQTPEDKTDLEWKPKLNQKKNKGWASLSSPPIYNFKASPSSKRGLNISCKSLPRQNLEKKLVEKKKEKYVAVRNSHAHQTVYEVERIVDHNELGPERFLYKVKWKGFEEADCTWEPLENLTNCLNLVYQYKMRELSRPASPIELRFQTLKKFLSQHTDEMLDIFVQSFRNDQGELYIPKVDLLEIHSYIRNFARNPELIQTNKVELDYLREQLLTHILYEKRLVQMDNLKRYEMEINVTTGNAVAPIYVINNVDLEVVPTNFTHTNHNIPTEGVQVAEEPVIWCTCEGNCVGSESCCGQANFSVTAYDSNKRLLIGQGTPIYECNKNCKCDATCPNRVIQLGTQVKLAIYKTYNGCGWGVQTLEPIPKGTFVTEYVGEILTYEAASRRENQTYLFNLDFNGSTRYVIDACYYGNISHFINHSCEPNLAVFAAYIQCLDPDLHRLPLFATRDIAKGEQLSFSYYKSVGRPGPGKTKLRCKCDAKNCCGYLNVES